jgi:hypothetical protein
MYKIIQIAVADHPQLTYATVYGLDEDGNLWIIDGNNKWKLIIPNDKERI